MKYVLLAGLGMWGGVTFAHAQDPQAPTPHSPPCISLAKMKALPANKNIVFTPMTQGQYHFAQAIFALDPRTPKGLPPGATGMIATAPDKDGGVVLYMQGTLACYPIVLGKDLLAVLNSVKTGKLDTNGDEL